MHSALVCIQNSLCTPMFAALPFTQGEDIVDIAVGSSHAAALSTGGDAFVWGVGSYGRLGLGHERTVPGPTLLTMGIPPDAETVSSCLAAPIVE